jgi:TolB protein
MITRNVKPVIIVASLLVAHAFYAADAPVTINVAVKAHAKTNLLLGILNYQSHELEKLADVMQRDLSFSHQFNVVVKVLGPLKTKDEVRAFFDQGYPLAILLSSAVNNDHMIDWRLYDTSQVMMVKGKRYSKRGDVLRGWAHNISDTIWPELTGQTGFFSTKIAYGKQVSAGKRKRPLRHIYVADYDGSDSKPLVTTPTINVAPRWNRDESNPLVFYSEGTNANIRLMTTTMDGKRTIASNFDGINMLPSFSSDGKKVVYTASHGSASCQIYRYEKGKITQLTDNPGNNLAATLTADGKSMYLCSDFPSGTPHIYMYDFNTQQRQQITFGGQEFCPAYCEKNHKVAYTKSVHGSPQLFVYDETGRTHKQLTFDRGCKDECSWSPCGNYLLFSVEEGLRSHLEILHVLTGERRIITGANENCNYPSWSPIYAQLPVVRT